MLKSGCDLLSKYLGVWLASSVLRSDNFAKSLASRETARRDRANSVERFQPYSNTDWRIWEGSSKTVCCRTVSVGEFWKWAFRLFAGSFLLCLPNGSDHCAAVSSGVTRDVFGSRIIESRQGESALNWPELSIFRKDKCFGGRARKYRHRLHIRECSTAFMDSDQTAHSKSKKKLKILGWFPAKHLLGWVWQAFELWLALKLISLKTNLEESLKTMLNLEESLKTIFKLGGKLENDV